MQVLPVYFLLSLHLYLLALLYEILFDRHVLPSSLSDHPTYLVDLGSVGQLHILQFLLLFLRLLFDYVQVALLDVCLVVESAGYVFVDAAEVLARQAAFQRLVERLYLVLLHYLNVDGLVVLALFVG